MKIIKFIVKENIKEGYSLGEQLIDMLGVGAFLAFFLMVM
jgi:hypothetical protein